MIIIDTYQKSLEINSDVAGINWTVSWTENNLPCSQVVPFVNNKEDQGDTINGIVTIVSVPQKNTPINKYYKEIEYISVYNSTISNATINIQIDISGTPKTIFKIILLPSHNLIYNEDSGWDVYDINGSAPSPLPIFDDMTYIQLAGTDTYTGTIPGLISYTQILNKKVGVILSNPNTGATTFNFNSLGAKPVTAFGFRVLVANDLGHIGQMYDAVWDGTQFQITSPTDNIQDNV